MSHADGMQSDCCRWCLSASICHSNCSGEGPLDAAWHAEKTGHCACQHVALEAWYLIGSMPVQEPAVPAVLEQLEDAVCAECAVPAASCEPPAEHPLLFCVCSLPRLDAAHSAA